MESCAVSRNWNIFVLEMMESDCDDWTSVAIWGCEEARAARWRNSEYFPEAAPDRPELPIPGLHLCYFGFDLVAEPNPTRYKNRSIVILRKELFRASLEEHAVV